MVNLEVPLELCEYGMNSATTAYASTYQQILMNPANYDGATYYFEIVATNSNASTAYNVGLRDVTNSSTKVNISVPANTTARTRIRSSSFTPASGNYAYAVYSPATTLAEQVVVYEARIVVVQVDATKTRIQIPLLNSAYNARTAYNTQYVDNRNSTTAGQSVSAYFPIFKYVAANWFSVPTNGFTLESCTSGSASNRTSTVYLYNKTDNTSVASVAVTGSTPSVQSTSWSAGATNWHDGDDYEIRHKISNASYYSRPGNAYLYITLNVAYNYEVYWKVSRARTAAQTATMNEYQRAQLNPDNYDAESIYFEATGYCADNGTRVHLNDEGTSESSASGSNVTGADINFNSGTKARQRTTSTISLDNGDRFITDIDASTNNLELSAAFVVFLVVSFGQKSLSDSGSGSDALAPKRLFTLTEAKTGASNNIIPEANDSNFEGGTVGNWGSEQGIVIDSADPYEGTYCAKAQCATANPYSNALGVFIPVTASADYVFSAYIKSNATREASVWINWYTSGEVYISGNWGFFNPNGTGYERKYVTATAPGTAAYAYVGFNHQSPQVGDILRIDNAQFEPGTTPTDYAPPGSASESNADESLSLSQKTAITLVDWKANPKNKLPVNVANGAESGTVTGLNPGADVTLTAQTGLVYAGSYAISYYNNGSNKAVYLSDSDLVPTTPGTDWVFSLYLNNPDYVFDYGLAWYNSSKELLSTSYSTITPAGFRRLYKTASAPANTAYVGIYLEGNSYSSAYFDNMQLEQGTYPSGWELPFTPGLNSSEVVTKASGDTAKSISDSGSDSEALSQKNTLTIPQTGSGSESPAIKNKFTVQQSGTDSEALALKNQLMTQKEDAIEKTEVLSLKNKFTIQQTATDNELLIPKNKFTGVETVSGSETISSVGKPLIQENISKLKNLAHKQLIDAGHSGTNWIGPYPAGYYSVVHNESVLYDSRHTLKITSLVSYYASYMLRLPSRFIVGTNLFDSYDVCSQNTYYTLTLPIKTDTGESVSRKYQVQFFDGSKTYLSDVLSGSSINIPTDWTEDVFTFQTPPGCAYIRVYLHFNAAAYDYFYMGRGQIEEGNSSTSFEDWKDDVIIENLSSAFLKSTTDTSDGDETVTYIERIVKEIAESPSANDAFALTIKPKIKENPNLCPPNVATVGATNNNNDGFWYWNNPEGDWELFPYGTRDLTETFDGMPTLKSFDFTDDSEVSYIINMEVKDGFDVTSGLIPVESNKRYTITLPVKTTYVPTQYLLFEVSYGFRRANKSYISGGGSFRLIETGVWKELKITINTPADAAYIYIDYAMWESSSPAEGDY